METTRLQILRLLQQRHKATVEEIAQAVCLASATIRRHLDILLRDHLVAYSSVRKAVGRPQYHYTLTERGHEMLPKGYARLLGSLVEELNSMECEEVRGLSGPEVLRTTLQRIADRMVDKRLKQSEQNGSATKLDMAVDILREQDFAPQVEKASDGTAHIRLLNCPFRTVSMMDESVCAFDRQLLSLLLGNGVKKEECIHWGSPCCSYLASVSKFPSVLAVASPSDHVEKPLSSRMPTGRLTP